MLKQSASAFHSPFFCFFQATRYLPTIVENCGNTLILRCSASKQGGTAKVASRLSGDREIFRAPESRSRRGGSWESSRTLSEQHVTEAAVLPSEIEQLPDLSGYLKFASSLRWQRVQIPLPRR